MSRKLTSRYPVRSMSIFEPLEGRQLMAAGDLDLTFGDAGKIASGNLPFAIKATAVQADGKIVAVGSMNNDFAVMRLNPDGKLDRSFNTRGEGIATADFGGNEGDRANAVTIQPDGKIVVVGVRLNAPTTVFGTKDRIAVARYNRDGSLDNSFAGNGLQTVDVGAAEALAVSVHPDGKIAIVGHKNIRSGQDSDYAIVRLNPNGNRDESFGDDGEVKVRFSFEDRDEQVRAVLALPDGKVLVGAQNRDQLGIWRFNANGDRDGTFGSGGMTFFNVAKPRLNALAIDPETRKVVAVGDSDGLLTVVRLTARGTRDNSFGTAGVVMQRFANAGTAFSALPIAGGRLLVSGTASGDSNMMMFKSDGKFETAFAQGGIAIRNLGGSDAIKRLSLDSSGRILALATNSQGQVIQARFQNVAPIVEVQDLPNNQTTEGSNQPGAILIKRDGAYNFATRVFLDISGPAIEGLDYTSPVLGRTPIVSEPGRTGSGTLAPIQILGSRRFVDIPAGQSSVTAPINAKADSRIEGNEVVRWAPIADPSYQLGAGTAGHVTIHDNTSLRVNFQVATNVNAFGYAADRGLPFGPRDRAIDPNAPDGQQFGWDVDNTANARDRGLALPGYIYNTFNHMQKPGGARTWEVALPNGMYEVKLAAGDPQNTDSVYRMNLEGQPALSGTPAGRTRWFESTTRVQVTDGRLTLTNGAGAVNNKIAFIEIRSAAPGAAAGPITGNVPVLLPLIANLPESGTIFSQIRI